MIRQIDRQYVRTNTKDTPGQGVRENMTHPLETQKSADAEQWDAWYDHRAEIRVNQHLAYIIWH